MYVDAHGEMTSNWMRYVNCARNDEEQNLVAFQYLGKIYYRTFKIVPDSVELLVWYGEKYAEELGLHSLHPIKALGSTGKAGAAENKDGDGLQDVSCLRLFPCHSCSCVMLSALALVRHVTRKHSAIEMKRHGCPYCSYSTDNNSRLLCHIRTHTGERPFVCVSCKKGFTVKANMETHERTVHHGLKPFACQFCGKQFGWESGCRWHIRTTHLGQTPLHCDICGKRFASKGNYRTHRRRHTGEKPYACDVCEKRFAVSSNLKYHRRIHSGKKPYQCNVCQTRFTQSSALKAHQRLKNHGSTDQEASHKNDEQEPQTTTQEKMMHSIQQPLLNERNSFPSEE